MPSSSRKDLETKEPESEPGSSGEESGVKGSGSDVGDKETGLIKGEVPEDPEKQAKEMAERMSVIVDTALDRLKPFLEMMVEESIEIAQRKKEKDQEIDEQELVDQVKPLLERATTILQECYGAIKALDPDGKTSNNAQNRSKNSEASAEKQRLAQGLAMLAGEVIKTIECIKDFIKDMPYAKNQLGPLLDLFGGKSS